MGYPIRVLEIISGFAVEGPLGGIERFGIELSQALNPEIVEPILCGLWAYHVPYEQDWVQHLMDNNIAAFIAADWQEQAPYVSFLRAVRAIPKYISSPVDIVHSHCQFGDIAALLLARQLGAKWLVRTVHNEREWPKRPLRRLFLTNLTFPVLFDAEAGVSRRVVENLDARPAAKLLNRSGHCIYNALNIERFSQVCIDRQEKRRALGVKDDEWLVGTIGRLTLQKGYTVLLNAVKEVLSLKPNVRFLIVGTGELEQALKIQARQLSIDQRVIFTGARKDIEELLYAMDLFVNSSLWEGLPTVILESMAAKVPVVATRVSGNIELVEHQRTGLLVPPDQSTPLANAIVKLLTDRELAFSFVGAAYQHIQTRFSIQTVARLYEDLYISHYQKRE